MQSGSFTDLPQAGGLIDQIIPLWDACGSFGRSAIMRDCGFAVSGHFQQMSAYRIQPMIALQPVV
jgi:hypothetical protein